MVVWVGILYTMLVLVGIIVGLMVTLYIGKTVTMGFCQCKKRLDGKVVLITGSVGSLISCLNSK